MLCRIIAAMKQNTPRNTNFTEIQARLYQMNRSQRLLFHPIMLLFVAEFN